MRNVTTNLSMGFQTVRWNDTMHQVQTLFPDAFVDRDALIVPRFSRFDPDVSLCAKLVFKAGELEAIELYPSIENELRDWTERKQRLVARFETLKESNRSADVKIEEDWADVHVKIRRKPMGM